MNAHIELVKKWLADHTSVTQQELEDNAYAAAIACNVTAYADAAYGAAYAAAIACNVTAYADAASYTDAAEYWVKRYEELTK